VSSVKFLVGGDRVRDSGFWEKEEIGSSRERATVGFVGCCLGEWDGIAKHVVGLSARGYERGCLLRRMRS